MTVVASAPGKIVLSGEYAVLDGGPAISMAVDRRAVVTMEDRPEGQCDLSTPGFEGKDKYRIVDAVCGGSRPAKNIVMDTRAFTEDGEKTGIGSSAALTVALVACLRESDDVLGKSLLAHRAFQGGKGSGVDVATAVRGGLVEFEMQSQSVTSLAWPSGLCIAGRLERRTCQHRGEARETGRTGYSPFAFGAAVGGFAHGRSLAVRRC